MKDDEKRISDVFRQRLSETRQARALSLGALGRLMRDAGHRTIDKAAVLRIEQGKRGISLDEAFAFASVLFAVPAQLFTPPGDERVYITQNYAVDGEEMRAWLRYGDAFVAHGGDLPEELWQDRAMEAMAVHARALIDANRNKDKAGIQDAFRAMRDVLYAERERREAGEPEKAES
jgi:transcriptional regulator with XRE-family HTH domain